MRVNDNLIGCCIFLQMKAVKDFRFKKFTVSQEGTTHKVGTDGVLLGAWVDVANANRILDIGTGSGVIALMLAQRTQDALIDAVELQEHDAAQAQLNFERSPWSERLYIYRTAIQNFTPGTRYDVIVSNPPYFQNSWLPPAKERSIVRHTHDLRFSDLLDCVHKLLTPEGRFAVILPFTEGREFVTLAANFKMHCIRACNFRSRSHKPIERLLLEFSFSYSPLLTSELILYQHAEEWSESYRHLMKDFYLKA